MAFAIFWTTAALLCYAFVGYPLLLRLAAALFGTGHRPDERYTPRVSIILSVYNEEAVIREKIENFLALDYPPELLEFIIISDGCEDRTEEIVRDAAGTEPRLRLFVQEERGGKTRALNRGSAEARGEILVFTDANSMFDRYAVRMLVRHFAAGGIGLVSGRSVYLAPTGGGEVTGGIYRAYEEYLKAMESRIGSIIGADGAIYALRRELYEPLEPRYINDFLHTIQAVLRGKRAISDPDAICREVIDEQYDGEFRRQTRIMAQSWLIYLSQIGRLIGHGRFLYAWQLTSHKLLRWLTLPLLVLFIGATAVLAAGGGGYPALLAAQVCFLLLTLAGWRGRGGIARTAYLFVILHLAAVRGFFQFLGGNAYTVWNPRNN